MDKDKVLAFAREAGLKVGANISGVVLVGSPAEIGLAHLTIDELERFAALVAAAEREACAQVCDNIAANHSLHDSNVSAGAAEDCAELIRARGQA